jgi:hypothetical protein
MTLTWTISREQRLVEAVAHGNVGAGDLLGFVRDMQAAGLRSYAKLIDFSHGSAELHARDIQALADAHAASPEGEEARGPTAIVIDQHSDDDAATLYARRSVKTARRFAVFHDRQHALDWLMTA